VLIGASWQGVLISFGDFSCGFSSDLARVAERHTRRTSNAVLEAENLKVDREGRPRTAYSLRHTYICLHLMEGADIYQIAKNCRTSVEMIEECYASHIKTNLDAAEINKMRPRPKKKQNQLRTQTPPGHSTPETDV
jgi:integrase